MKIGFSSIPILPYNIVSSYCFEWWLFFFLFSFFFLWFHQILGREHSTLSVSSLSTFQTRASHHHLFPDCFGSHMESKLKLVAAFKIFETKKAHKNAWKSQKQSANDSVCAYGLNCGTGKLLSELLGSLSCVPLVEWRWMDIGTHTHTYTLNIRAYFASSVFTQARWYNLIPLPSSICVEYLYFQKH